MPRTSLRRASPIRGWRPFSTGCDAAGFKLGICTNKQERLSIGLLDALGLTQRFGAIVGADTIGIAKPDPAPYRETVKRLGADGGSIMIGDSETDILTARAAGVPVIGVTFGYTERHVSEFGPDHRPTIWTISGR